jgi:hypothetical protein
MATSFIIIELCLAKNEFFKMIRKFLLNLWTLKKRRFAV